VEPIKPTYSQFNFFASDDLRRGGTAPNKPQQQEFAVQFRAPVSSHKYGVQPMNFEGSRNPTAQPLNRVTIRGTGWSSKRPSTQMVMDDKIMIKGAAKANFKIHEDVERPGVRQISTSQGLRPPSRHKTPPKAVGLELPPMPLTPPNLPQMDNKFEKTWSHSLHAIEEVDKSRRSQRNLPTRDGKSGRPVTVKKSDKSEDDISSRAQTSERPKTRGNVQADFDFNMLSPERNRKRPVTCKIYQVPIIVTRDNESKPDVEHTPFGKIINRRVCSANLARDKAKTAIKKGSFKSSLDSEFLKLFE